MPNINKIMFWDNILCYYYYSFNSKPNYKTADLFKWIRYESVPSGHIINFEVYHKKMLGNILIPFKDTTRNRFNDSILWDFANRHLISVL